MILSNSKLTKHQVKGLRWGSHVPVTTAVIKSFPVLGALELGAGRYSTSLLFDNLPYVTSIENDEEWISKLRKDIKEDQFHQIVHHPIPKYIDLTTPRKGIDGLVLEEAKHFYMKYVDKRFDYLFVDCFTGFRLEALQLYKHFNIIAFHDAQERSVYGYEHFKPNSDYKLYVDKTFEAHTGFAVSKLFEPFMPKFLETLEVEAKKFAASYDVDCELEFTCFDETDQ